MATKKKRKTKSKKAAKKVVRKAASLKVADIGTATAASVKAILGRAKPVKPGIIAGIVLDPRSVETLRLAPQALATKIAGRTSKAIGIKLKPAVVRGPGGILVGYIQPRLVRF